MTSSLFSMKVALAYKQSGFWGKGLVFIQQKLRMMQYILDLTSAGDKFNRTEFYSTNSLAMLTIVFSKFL